MRAAPSAGLALAVLIVCGPLPAAAALSLAGDWRPEGSDTADPELAPIECPPGDSICIEEHGTFGRDVYLRILEADDGSLTMISDGTLSATVTPRRKKPNAYTVAMTGGARAALHTGTAGCSGTPSCFEIVGSTDPGHLADGVYMPVEPWLEDKKLVQTLADQFSHVPANFDLAGHCYDITKMALDDFQNSQGCGQNVFLKFDDMAGTKRYKVISPSEGTTVAIPYGWKYFPRSEGWGGSKATILESGQDVSESHQRSIGWNTGLSLFVNISTGSNETTLSQIQTMYEKSSVYSQYNYVETDFALVLDKANAEFTPLFYKLVTQASKEAKPDFKAIIDAFGTHYAFATTMGERGSLFSTISKENVIKLHQEGVDLSAAVSAGASVPLEELGEAKSSSGITSGSSDSHFSKMASALGADYGDYHCIGGMSCNGQTATGQRTVPILLDLRPLSDLLGPPFFTEIDNLETLRAAFAKAIADYAAAAQAASPDGSAIFLKLSAPTAVYCPVNDDVDASDPRAAGCTLANLDIRTDGAIAQNVPGGQELVVATTDTFPDVQYSGDVSVPGIWCSSDQAAQQDNAIYSGKAVGQYPGFEEGWGDPAHETEDIEFGLAMQGVPGCDEGGVLFHGTVQRVSAASILIH
jgi:hypothetical protein